jgi:hypothetical protein
MKAQGLGLWIDHGQTNSTAQRLIEQLAILLPSVQSGQRIKLPLDGPIRANDHILSPKEPNSHCTLQQLGTLQSIWHVHARGQQRLA